MKCQDTICVFTLCVSLIPVFRLLQSASLKDDSAITLDEWYGYFEELAKQDKRCKGGDVEASPKCAEEVVFLEKQAGLLKQNKVRSDKGMVFAVPYAAM